MMRLVLAALLVVAPAPILAQTPNSSERLGKVRFATSCDARTAGDFNRAMALLHSFEFGEAIKGFQSVLAVDSTCAIAHWGIALSRWSNPMAAGNRSNSQLSSGLEAVKSARLAQVQATDRERGYIA